MPYAMIYILISGCTAVNPFTLKNEIRKWELIQHSGNVVDEHLLGQSPINQMSYNNFMLG